MGVDGRPRAEDALVTVSQAAAMLAVHPNTIRAWCDAGRLRAYRINRRGDRRLRRRDLEALLTETSGQHPGHEIGTRRDRELAVLARLAKGAASAAAASEIARLAVDSLVSCFGYARAALYLLQGSVLQLEAHVGRGARPPAQWTPGRPGPINAALLTGEPAAFLPEPSGSRPALATGEAPVPQIAVPLAAVGDVLGVLDVQDDRLGSLSDADVAFLRTVADQVTVAIENARLIDRVRRELDRAEALRAIAAEISSKLEPSTILEEVTEYSRVLFKADKVGLWLLQDGRHPFELATRRGLSDAFVERVRELTAADDSAGMQAMRRREARVIRAAGSSVAAGLIREAYALDGIETACLTPLVYQGEPLGLLGLYHVTDHRWPDDEVALARAFGNQMAAAIQNARLYRAVSDQAARMRSIHELTVRLNRLSGVKAIGEAIVAEAAALAEHHDVRVYVVDWETRMCEPVAFSDQHAEEGDLRQALRIKVGTGLTGWVAEHGEALLIDDARSDPRALQIPGTDDVDESLLLVPMLYEERVRGIIVLSKLGIGQFSDDDLQTMSIFAGHAAHALANAAAYEQLERQSRELERQIDSQRKLLEISERLVSTLDHAGILDLIADSLRSVVSYDDLSIYRLDAEHAALVPVLVRDVFADEVSAFDIPLGRGLNGWVVEHGEALLTNDPAADPRAIQIPGTPAESEAMIIVPLFSHGEVTGTMNVGRLGDGRHFSETDFELVKLFAGQASVALQNVETHQALAERAETDPLTGLGNHGAFQRSLSELLEAPGTAEGAQRLAILMMDLDKFKRYNDDRGHPAGDTLIHSVSLAISGAARAEDLIYRYGGDEFAAILIGADAEQARVVGERIRGAVNRIGREEGSAVSITVGVAASGVDGADKNALIAAADAALYYGKQAGEDRVVLAREVPGEMRDLRSALQGLTLAALQPADRSLPVARLVQRAARLAGNSIERARAETAAREAVLLLARTIETVDGRRGGHPGRVSRLALLAAERLDLDDETRATVELAARLHEVGDRLEPIRPLRRVREVLRSLDERVDGSGRPDGLSGEKIPIEAQLVAVADAYDAMTTGQGGGPRLSRADAVARLRHEVGRRFREDVVEALAAVVIVHRERAQRRRRDDRAQLESGAA